MKTTTLRATTRALIAIVLIVLYIGLYQAGGWTAVFLCSAICAGVLLIEISLNPPQQDPEQFDSLRNQAEENEEEQVTQQPYEVRQQDQGDPFDFFDDLYTRFEVLDKNGYSTHVDSMSILQPRWNRVTGSAEARNWVRLFGTYRAHLLGCCRPDGSFVLTHATPKPEQP